MANELTFHSPANSGDTLYAHLENMVGQVWSGASFEAPVSGNWANYDIEMNEASGTGIFRGDMPAADAGGYSFVVRLRAGGGPSVSDIVLGSSGIFSWSGLAITVLDTAIATLGTAATSTLDATLTAYVDYVGGDAYFSQKLYVTAWSGATNANKTKALIEATQRIDRLRFAGFLVDDDQVLEFPRYYDEDEGAQGDEEVPADIQYACCELAYSLLDGVDPDLEYENMGVGSHAYSSVRQTHTSDPMPHIAAGIPNASAWRYLAQYLAPAKTIKMKRVS